MMQAQIMIAHKGSEDFLVLAGAGILMWTTKLRARQYATEESVRLCLKQCGLSSRVDRSRAA